ncbi:MAG TPA: VWA domain-containing protein, partial [Bryobacteraceae bacterium]|nr:VWA domain-containing protein [Bryobacteraceae bacterium]
MKNVCLILLLAAATAQAQDVIRVESREVLVDVTVTGKGDTSNLTAKDFSVWEDGKQQTITSVTRAAADSDAGPRHFVIYLDFSMLPYPRQAEAESAAEGFIDSMASPDRYMAVASIGIRGPVVLQNFTNAKEPLKKAAAAPVNPSPYLASTTFIGAGGTPLNELGESLASLCDSLRSASGRTSILLFTGAVVANTSSLEAVTKACNRSNAALDVIASEGSMPAAASNVRGRGGYAGPGGMATQTLSPGTLAQYLAESTGGRVLQFSSKLPEELASIAREQDDVYRLAYVPPESKEGSCHTLKVATKMHGAQLNARKGYCTEKQVDIVAGKIAGQALEAKAGTGNLSATMALPWFYTGANRASVHLAVDVIPAGVKFEKDKTGLHGEIDLVGSAVRTDGGTAARFADTVDLDAPDQQQADALMKTPYHYEHTFNIAPGDYKFQLSLGTGPNAVAKL